MKGRHIRCVWDARACVICSDINLALGEGDQMTVTDSRRRGGIGGFLRDVFLDPDEVEHERRFDMRSLPLAVTALASGFAYSRTGLPWLAVIAALFAAAYTVYFVMNRTMYVIHTLRGENVLGRSRPSTMKGSPAWVRWLNHMVDDDRVYAVLGGYGVPLAGSAAMAIWSVTGQTWLLWLVGVLSVLYAVYWLATLFVGANRRLSGLLRDRESRLDEARRRMERMHRDRELAGRTHDTVAGGLSYIAFFAQQRMEDSSLGDGEREAWRQVDQAAQRTLNDVHRVIDVLDGGVLEPVTLRRSVSAMIGERVDAGAAHLRELGFEGRISVDCEAADGMPFESGALREVTDLIDELFVNVAAHADPSHSYVLSISAEKGWVNIVQTDVAAQGDRFHRIRSGRGLGLHRGRIRALGGVLNTSLEDDEWMLYAQVPLDKDMNVSGAAEPVTDAGGADA